MNCSLCGADNLQTAASCVSCGAALSSAREAFGDALAPATTLQNGAFRVDAVLGQGGFGITYRGFDLSLQREVAVKEFFPFGSRRGQNAPLVQPSQALSPADYATFKTRFVEEARVLARFKHPSIVDVYAVWEENNAAYLVMELLEGQTLEQLLQTRNAPLEERETLDFAAKIGGALREVHRHGLLHRDIKPANIMLCDDGRVMLIDFGTAREYKTGAPQSLGHSIVVTPGYAPLEQYAERATRGAYTDIYSLAATLYHLLTGEMPPAASDRALGVELKSAHELNPKVSPIVATALGCAMETQVARRPQSIDEFLQMLRGEIAPTQAKSATSSTRSSSAALPSEEERPSLSYTPKFPQKEKSTFNENASFDATYERMSLEARAKLESTFGASHQTSDTAQAQLTPNQARQQLLDSFPLSEAEAAQREALAKLATTRSAAKPALPTAKDMFPPSQFPSGSSIGVKQKPRNSSLDFGAVVGLCILVWFMVMLISPGRHDEPTSYDSPQTTITYDTTDDNFLQNQGFYENVAISTKELTDARYGQLDMGLFSADGKTLAVFESQNYQTHVYAVSSLKPLCAITLGSTGNLRISDDGAILANCDGKKITVWRTRDGKKLCSWPLPTKYAEQQSDYALSPDGKYVVALSGISKVTMWNARTGDLVSRTSVLPKSNQLLFTRDSKRWLAFLTGDSRYQIQVHDVASRKVVVKSVDAKNIPKNSFTYPELLTDTLLLTSSNGIDATFIDLKKLKIAPRYSHGVRPLDWPANFESTPMTWSRDARLVLCRNTNNGKTTLSVREFNPQTTTFGRTALLTSSSEQILNGGFSPDNKTLYALNQNGQLLTWRIDGLGWR